MSAWVHECIRCWRAHEFHTTDAEAFACVLSVRSFTHIETKCACKSKLSSLCAVAKHLLSHAECATWHSQARSQLLGVSKDAASARSLFSAQSMTAVSVLRLVKKDSKIDRRAQQSYAHPLRRAYPWGRAALRFALMFETQKHKWKIIVNQLFLPRLETTIGFNSTLVVPYK